MPMIKHELRNKNNNNANNRPALVLRFAFNSDKFKTCIVHAIYGLQ